MRLSGSFARLGGIAVLGTTIAGCSYGFPPAHDAFTVVNRTTVPVVVADHGSVSVVAACSERTLAWHGSWGGDSDYKPVAEPIPSGAWVLPASDVEQPIEGPLVVRVVVTKSEVGESADGNAPCDGVPPASPTDSPGAAPTPPRPT